VGSRRGHGEWSIFRRADDGKWLAVVEIGRDPATGKRMADDLADSQLTNLRILAFRGL